MLQVHTLPLGAYQTNCYILSGNGTGCVIIDPGYEADTIISALKKLDLTAEAILLTHGHFDHVGAVKPLSSQLGCPVFLCEKELSLPPMMTAGPLFYTNTYAQGDTLSFAGLSIGVMQTPGHTPGSVCLTVENAMFSGDTLFAGSCGRVDFPGSSAKDMRASLSRLAALDGDWDVYPGHGEATTLSLEKRYNPYLKGTL